MAKRTPIPKHLDVSIKPSERLPWDTIRLEYEGGVLNIRAIMRKYRVRSKTTIIRRRDAEKWAEPGSVRIWSREDIAKTKMPTGGVHAVDSVDAAIATPPPAPEAPNPHPGSSFPGYNFPPGRRKKAPPILGLPVLEDAERIPADQSVISSPFRTGGTAAERSMRAQAIASMQEKQIKAEQHVAELAMEVSVKVLRALDTILTSRDEAEVTRTADRLRKLPGSQEGFAALLRGSVGSFKEAVAVRRRAIGMDPPKTASNASLSSAPVRESEIPSDIARLLPTLDGDTLEGLQQLAMRLEKIRTDND